MEQHKNSIGCKLLDFAWDTKIIQSFQGSLALVVLHHVALLLTIQPSLKQRLTPTHSFESHASVNLIYLDGKLIFNSLNLQE